MSTDYLTDQGLGHGRNWSALPADGGPIEWTMDPEGDLIQGPLDLSFMRGQRFSLVLEEGQLALLTRDRELLGVYLDGAHTMDVGTDEKQIPVDGRLLFLATNRTMDLAWNRREPLAVGRNQSVNLIGSCNLVVERPARFYRTFLDASDGQDFGFVLRLIDQMVRSMFEEKFTDLDISDPASAANLQSRLMRLGPDDLADDLEACGLRCVNLALYTSAPPVEMGLTENEPLTAGS